MVAWEVTSEASSDVRRAMGVSSDIRRLGRAIGVVITTSEAWKDMNDSLPAVRLPIRKPGPHNSHGPVGTLK